MFDYAVNTSLESSRIMNIYKSIWRRYFCIDHYFRRLGNVGELPFPTCRYIQDESQHLNSVFCFHGMTQRLCFGGKL